MYEEVSRSALGQGTLRGEDLRAAHVVSLISQDFPQCHHGLLKIMSYIGSSLEFLWKGMAYSSK